MDPNQLSLESETEFVRFDFLEVMPEGLPCAGDRRARVEIITENFRGIDASVWIAMSDVVTFLAEVDLLAQGLNTDANLVSLSAASSYQGFKLQIFQLNNTGNLGMRARLVSTVYLKDKPHACEASIYFVIEMEQLLSWCRTLNRVFQG